MVNPTHTEFADLLLEWYSQSNRPMPWKGIKDPYLIWISEVILQQTRVEQGWNYYLRFTKRFPDVFSLAEAKEDEVLKLWEGLGYYSRARNLHFTSKLIVEKYKGIFPEKYEDILSLKGIGGYTAAAISSFAFSKHYAVIDGNVQRVFARIFNISTPVDTTDGKKTFSELANQCILTVADPGLYNQAIMDFGATICKPSNPECKICPLNLICLAYEKAIVNELPVKVKSIKRRTRYFQFYIVRKADFIYIQQRIEKDIWRQLFQFPISETESLQEPDPDKIVQDKRYLLSVSKSLVNYKQQLTHQSIVASFCEIKVSEDWNPSNTEWMLIKEKDIGNYAFPRIINDYLNNMQMPLNLSNTN